MLALVVAGCYSVSMGAPSIYNQEIATQICDYIADGYSLRKIQTFDGMPERRTIMQWESRYPDFADQIACAREAKTEDDIEELEEINAKVANGTLDPQQAVVISNNLKWVAGKLKPKKYGDKQIISGDPDAPIGGRIINVQQKVLDMLSVQQLETIIELAQKEAIDVVPERIAQVIE